MLARRRPGCGGLDRGEPTMPDPVRSRARFSKLCLALPEVSGAYLLAAPKRLAARVEPDAEP